MRTTFALLAFVLAPLLGGCGTYDATPEVVDNDFRDDVIACEEAASHIRECCPNASSSPDCHYSRVDYYCGLWPYKSRLSSSVTDTPLSEDDSASISGESCDDMVADGTCIEEWSSNAVPPTPPKPLDYDCGACGC